MYIIHAIHNPKLLFILRKPIGILMNDKKQWELYENTHKTVYYIVSSTAIE